MTTQKAAQGSNELQRLHSARANVRITPRPGALTNPYSLSLDQMGLLKDYETIFTAVGKTHSANSRFSKCVTN